MFLHRHREQQIPLKRAFAWRFPDLISNNCMKFRRIIKHADAGRFAVSSFFRALLEVVDLQRGNVDSAPSSSNQQQHSGGRGAVRATIMFNFPVKPRVFIESETAVVVEFHISDIG